MPPKCPETLLQHLITSFINVSTSNPCNQNKSLLQILAYIMQYSRKNALLCQKGHFWAPFGCDQQAGHSARASNHRIISLLVLAYCASFDRLNKLDEMLQTKVRNLFQMFVYIPSAEFKEEYLRTLSDDDLCRVLDGFKSSIFILISQNMPENRQIFFLFLKNGEKNFCILELSEILLKIN